MSKIKIKTTINNEKFLFKGIKNQNKIIYKDNDVLVTIDISNTIVLTRENLDFKLQLTFDQNKETIGSYLLKMCNNYLELKVKTKKLVIESKFIEIIYIINNSDEIKNFKLEFEEI